MINEKTTIKCESIFDDAHTHRYMWRRVWQKDKPLAAVICLQPSLSDNIVQDTTTALVVNNIARLERFGGVVILNLFSMLTSKLNFRYNSDEELCHRENDEYIMKAAQECDTIVLAWGKGGNTNDRIAKRAEQVIRMLSLHEDKLYVITDGERSFLHPLTPQIRQSWELVKFDPHTDAKHQEGKAVTDEPMETADDEGRDEQNGDATIS